MLQTNLNLSRSYLMKLSTALLISILALSTTTASASSDWFDGMQDGAGNGNAAGKTSAWTKNNGNGAGNGAGKMNSWGKAKGDADGEVDFAITFKGKGRTNMDTAMSADAKGEGAGNTLANWAGAGNGDAKSAAQVDGKNTSKAVGELPGS